MKFDDFVNANLMTRLKCLIPKTLAPVPEVRYKFLHDSQWKDVAVMVVCDLVKWKEIA
jgi:hypothetical protein